MRTAEQTIFLWNNNTDEEIYRNGGETSFCNFRNEGCNQMTKSILSEDRTHFNCEECGKLK